MATSGILKTDSVFYGTYFQVSWERTSFSEANNTSTIKWTVYLSTESASWYSNSIKINYLYINGDQVIANQTYGNKSHGTFVLATGSKTIPHNTDGTKTFAVSFSGWLIDEGNLTASGNFTLDKINRGKPTASLSVSAYNDNPALTNIYVKGFSKINYTITGTAHPDSGATITGYEFKGNGETINTQSGRTGLLTTSGINTLQASVTDSRGVRSDDTTTQIEVLDYTLPKINSADAYRSDAQGNRASRGTYITLSCSASVGATLQNQNTISQITYSILNNETQQAVTETLSNNTSTTISGFAEANSFTVTITAYDSVGNSVIRTIAVPMALTTLHLAEGGTGVAVGKLSEHDESFEVNSDWDVYFGGYKIDYVIESGTSGNWHYKKWANGECVLWGIHSITPSSSTQSGSMYYSNLVYLSTPFGVANAVISGTAANLHTVVNADGSFANVNISFRLLRPISIDTATAISVKLMVWGTWK